MSQKQDQKYKEGMNKIKKLSAQSEDLTNELGVEVHRQGQQIDSIEKDVKDVNKQADSAYHKTKRISSFFYWVKDSLKKHLKPNRQEKVESENVKKEEMDEKKYKSDITYKHEVAEQEEIDEIVQQMKRAKNHQKYIGDELQKQNKQLNNMDKNVDKAMGTMEKVNKKMKKDILKE